MKSEQKLEYPVPKIFREQLDKVKKRVLTKDMDWVCAVDGEEGVGKSVLAMQIGKYLDPNFTLDNIVFNSDQFLKKIKDPATKKGTCILLDETFSAASSRSSLSEVNKSMIGVATEMRQRNLFILMVLPSFFDLDKYFALWRCKALVHVFFDDKGDRNYILFPKEHKKLLYIFGKKTYNYRKPKSPFPVFNFPNYYTVNEEEYRTKKAEAFSGRKVSMKAENWLTQRNSYIEYLVRKIGLKQEEVGNIPEKKVDQAVISRLMMKHMDLK